MGADLLLWMVTAPEGEVDPQPALDFIDSLDRRQLEEICDMDPALFGDDGRSAFREPDWASTMRDNLKSGIHGIVHACNARHRYTMSEPIDNTDRYVVISGGVSFGDEPYDGWNVERFLVQAYCDPIERMGLLPGIVAPLRDVPTFTDIDQANRWLEGRMVT